MMRANEASFLGSAISERVPRRMFIWAMKPITTRRIMGNNNSEITSDGFDINNLCGH